MDQHRFDDLVKRFAGSRSRRGVLKAIAGGAVSAIAVAVGVRDAEARKFPVGERCRYNRDCVSNLCFGGSCRCQTSTDCPTCQACKAGGCIPAFDGDVCPSAPGGASECCGGACKLVENQYCSVDDDCCGATSRCTPTPTKGIQFCCPLGATACDLGCCSPGDVCTLSAGFTVCCPAGTTMALGDSCCPVDTTVVCDSGCCSAGSACSPGAYGGTVCCPAGTTVCGYDGCCGSNGEVCMTEPVFGSSHCCPADTKVVCETGCCAPGEICVTDTVRNTYCCPPLTQFACTNGCCGPNDDVCALDLNFETHCCPLGATSYCKSGGCCNGACDSAGNCKPRIPHPPPRTAGG